MEWLPLIYSIMLADLPPEKVCEQQYRLASAHEQEINAAYEICPSWTMANIQALATRRREIWFAAWWATWSEKNIGSETKREKTKYLFKFYELQRTEIHVPHYYP